MLRNNLAKYIFNRQCCIYNLILLYYIKGNLILMAMPNYISNPSMGLFHVGRHNIPLIFSVGCLLLLSSKHKLVYLCGSGVHQFFYSFFADFKKTFTLSFSSQNVSTKRNNYTPQKESNTALKLFLNTCFKNSTVGL